MRPYSLDLREKIVSAIENGKSAFRKTAERFSLNKSYVQKRVAQKRTDGHVVRRRQGGSVSIALAMNLMHPEHLRNWFAHGCYCAS